MFSGMNLDSMGQALPLYTGGLECDFEHRNDLEPYVPLRLRNLGNVGPAAPDQPGPFTKHGQVSTRTRHHGCVGRPAMG